MVAGDYVTARIWNQAVDNETALHDRLVALEATAAAHASEVASPSLIALAGLGAAASVTSRPFTRRRFLRFWGR